MTQNISLLFDEAMIPLILFLLALVVFSIHYAFGTSKGTAPLLLRYVIFFNIGIMGILAFYAHAFMADATAQKIGWPTGSPFQFEIAVANLSYGILGILCFFLNRFFWLATTIGNAIFLFGAFYGHLVQYSLGDVAPYNIGPAIWIQDLVIPILYLCLMGIVMMKNKF